MAIRYELKTENGRRQVVKTIDIHDESYDAIKRMIESGENSLEDAVGPFIDDAYNIFGGEAYRNIPSMAIMELVSSVVEHLYYNKMLKEDKEDLDLLKELVESAIFPIMCYTEIDENRINALHFFNPNEDEVIGMVEALIKEDFAKRFKELFGEARKSDVRPAGETALGLLIFVMQNEKDENNKDMN